jgi:hypothetical protein
MKMVYLAGFDVFREDARDWGEQLKALCLRYGYEGLYPLDKAAPSGLSGSATAQWIYEANIALIRRADVVMANLDDFRGPGSQTAVLRSKLGLPWRWRSPSGAMRPMPARCWIACVSGPMPTGTRAMRAVMWWRTSACR